MRTKLIYWAYYCYFFFAQNYVNYKQRLQMAIARPKYKVGDLVEYSLSYAKVVYRVDKINKHSYLLLGHKILSSDCSNPYMTEARRYDPFYYWFDKQSKLWQGE